MPVTVAAIAAILKAADPLEKLPSDIARTVGAKAIMDDVQRPYYEHRKAA